MNSKTHTEAGSLTYADAGERMRLSYERLVAAELGRQAWVVAGAVWMLTASYSKGADQVSASTIANLCGMQTTHVRRALRLLAKHGVIQWKPQHGRKGDWSEVRLPRITSTVTDLSGSVIEARDGPRDGPRGVSYLEATEGTKASLKVGLTEESVIGEPGSGSRTASPGSASLKGSRGQEHAAARRRNPTVQRPAEEGERCREGHAQTPGAYFCGECDAALYHANPAEHQRRAAERSYQSTRRAR